VIVFKYGVTPNTDNHLWLPVDSKILSVQEQGIGNLQCWVLQDQSPRSFETRIILVVGTGIILREGDGIIKDRLEYINTDVSETGFVWHSFERKSW
jgi:hypothetical protein